MKTIKVGKSRIKVPIPKASDEIEALLKQVKWRIGDPDQIRIRDQYTKVIELRREILGKEMKRRELKAVVESAMTAQKEVEQNEAWLIGSLKVEIKKQKLSTYPPSSPQI